MKKQFYILNHAVGLNIRYLDCQIISDLDCLIMAIKYMMIHRCHESGCHSPHLLHPITAAHHPWTASPIIHSTHTFPSTITPITQLSPITHLSWLSHHTCTSFTHTHLNRTLPCNIAKSCSCPNWHFWALFILLLVISVFDPGLPDLGTLNLCLWPRLLPGVVYVSALPLIFLFLPADLCLFDSVY